MGGKHQHAPQQTRLPDHHSRKHSRCSLSFLLFRLLQLQHNLLYTPHADCCLLKATSSHLHAFLFRCIAHGITTDRVGVMLCTQITMQHENAPPPDTILRTPLWRAGGAFRVQSVRGGTGSQLVPAWTSPALLDRSGGKNRTSSEARELFVKNTSVAFLFPFQNLKTSAAPPNPLLQTSLHESHDLLLKRSTITTVHKSMRV